MPQRPPEALLFDLGGVLVDIDFGRALNAWAPYSRLSLAELRSSFKHDVQYERHERGEIEATEYFAHLAKTLHLSANLCQIEQGWNSIFVGEIVRTRRLVENMRAHLPCYAFTNTNASHTKTWSRLFPSVVGAFDRIFASHELGLRKPDRSAYDQICQRVALPAASIVFYDDLPANVVAAEDAGLQGVLVRSPTDIASSLQSFGYEVGAAEA